jgi:hypothetical protein
MLHLVCPICAQLVRTVDESDPWCPWCRMTRGEDVTLVALEDSLFEVDWEPENEPLTR